jgi:hypothetical protein
MRDKRGPAAVLLRARLKHDGTGPRVNRVATTSVSVLTIFSLFMNPTSWMTTARVSPLGMSRAKTVNEPGATDR